MNHKICLKCGTKNYAAVLTHREEQDPKDHNRNLVLEEHRFDVCKHLDPDYPVYVVGYKYSASTYKALRG